MNINEWLGFGDFEKEYDNFILKLSEIPKKERIIPFKLTNHYFDLKIIKFYFEKFQEKLKENGFLLVKKDEALRDGVEIVYFLERYN